MLETCNDPSILYLEAGIRTCLLYHVDSYAGMTNDVLFVIVVYIHT